MTCAVSPSRTSSRTLSRRSPQPTWEPVTEQGFMRSSDRWRLGRMLLAPCRGVTLARSRRGSLLSVALRWYAPTPLSMYQPPGRWGEERPSVGGMAAAVLALAADAVVLADAAAVALLALAPAAVMLAYLRSPAFLALALLALVGADARPQALLALAPAAVMLAYLRSPAFLAPALDALVRALACRHDALPKSSPCSECSFRGCSVPRTAWLSNMPRGSAEPRSVHAFVTVCFALTVVLVRLRLGSK